MQEAPLQMCLRVLLRNGKFMKRGGWNRLEEPWCPAEDSGL